MTIYKIQSDTYKFKTLDLEIDDVIDLLPEHYDYMEVYEFSKNNLSLARDWPNMKTGYFLNEGGENIKPDIAPWINASLLLSAKASRLLGDLLKEYGELLPVQVDDEKCHIFNCRTLVNALPGTTETKTKLDEQTIGDQVIFKIPELNCMDLYCNDRLKELVDHFELVGIGFDENLAQFPEG